MKSSLRRFRSADDEVGKCPRTGGYHNAEIPIEDLPETKNAQGFIEAVSPDKYAGDPRWPKVCECGYVFSLVDDRDNWQVFRESIYRRTDTGEEMTLRNAPAGAIWNAWWLMDHRGGVNGQHLICRLPGGHDWDIDGRASNCDSPCANCGKPYHACQCKYPNGYRDARPHQCWVRHGTPPNLTVDKGAPGESCHAGAGSIIVPGWHGFLRNGALVSC